MADRPVDPASPGATYLEFGATGLRQYGGYVREEWLRELQGWRGMRVLREMRDNDPIVGAIFFAIEMLLRGVSFHVEGVGSAPEDQQAADFVTSCLADMERSWTPVLSEILSFLQYGWDVHEIVYKLRRGPNEDPRSNSRYDDGLIGWRKFAGRSQETLLHWEFDESGDAVAMIQLLPTGGPLLRVPLAKCLHFRTSVQKNNPEGRTILRNAYRPWYFKKRIEEIEAVGIERDLTGIPVMYVPAEIMKSDATATQKSLYEQCKTVVRDTSRNEQEGFVLPMAYQPVGPNGTPVQMFELKLLSTGGRRQFDTTAILQAKSKEIAGCVLADFITMGEGSRGSYAMSRNKTDMFSVAVVAFLEIICDEFNRKAIPDLLSLNAMTGQCRLAHGDISRRDLTEIAQYVFQLVQAGVILPDPVLDAHMREEAQLPPPNQDQLRDVADGDADDNTDLDPSRTRSNDPAAAQGRAAYTAAHTQ